MIMNGLLPIVSAFVLLGGMLFILVPLDLTLTLLSLTIIPALFVLIALFNRKITTVASEVRDTEGRVYSLVQWAIASVKVVQAFTREEDEYRRFMGASRASLDATLKLYNWQTFYSGAVNVVIAAGTAIVIYAGGRAVMSGSLSIGQLIIFISYLAQLYVPVNQITQSWGLIPRAPIGAPPLFPIPPTQAHLQHSPPRLPPPP